MYPPAEMRESETARRAHCNDERHHLFRHFTIHRRGITPITRFRAESSPLSFPGAAQPGARNDRRYFCSLNVPTKIVRQRFPVTKKRPVALS
jgi:hypothetical protein